MKLKAEQLNSHLAKGPLPLYIVSGDEPLLVQEACDQIRAAYKAQGFEERELFHGDKQDVEQFTQAGDSLSLFANLTLYEFRFTGNITKDFAEAFSHWCERNIEDQRLLICCPKLDKRATNAKWFKTIESMGAHIAVWPVEDNQLLGWLANRCQTRGFSLAPEVLKVIADRVQGNLLAAAQEIERIALVFGEQLKANTLDQQQLIDSIADNARFDVYHLIDKALLGQPNKVVRMLRGLKIEGESAARIAASLSYELRKLAQMAWQMQQGDALDSIMSRNRVWGTKKACVQAALRRHSATAWQRLLVKTLQLDKMIKGQAKGNPWVEAEQLLLLVAGHQVLRKAI